MKRNIVLAVSFAACATFAETALVGTVDGDRLEVKCGEKVAFDFHVIGTNGVQVLVVRYADDGKSGACATLTPDADGRCRFESSTAVPGALMAYAKVVTADGKPVKVKSGRRTVGLETALGIVCALPTRTRRLPSTSVAGMDSRQRMSRKRTSCASGDRTCVV